MIDIKKLRENPTVFEKAVHDKKAKVDISKILQLDKNNREYLAQINTLRAELKSGSKAKPSPEDITRLKNLGEKIKETEAQQANVAEELDILLSKVPNLPSDDTPVGPDESGNKVLREVGKKTEFKFAAKEHWTLGENLGILDIERATKVTGTRFVYLLGDLAMLQFALIQHALSIVTNESAIKKIIKQNKLTVIPKAFQAVIPPVFIRPEIMQRMSRLEPKEERYYIASDNQYLVGSAEHTLGPMYADEILEEKTLPIRYVGYSSAFRREAGSYGKDMKGMIRVHQFDKLELESFCLNETSVAEQDFFVAIQEHIVQSLKIPYRVVQICTGDMGGPDARQIDIECWMPGLKQYRETHTADLMTDYQSRRLKTRVRRSNGESELVHMNDATLLALGRTLIAILENYQNADGSITVPTVLQKYLGKKKITHAQ